MDLVNIVTKLESSRLELERLEGARNFVVSNYTCGLRTKKTKRISDPVVASNQDQDNRETRQLAFQETEIKDIRTTCIRKKSALPKHLTTKLADAHGDEE
jgi:hypothetical protein